MAEENESKGIKGQEPADSVQPGGEGSIAPSKGESDKVLRMGTLPVGRLLFEFGIPAVASTVLAALYNIIDSVFLGQAMGEIGLAATTVATPIMTIMMAIAVIAGAGGNALGAILLGEGRHDRAEQTLGNTMFLMIAFAVPVAFVATFCLDPILILVGASDVTLPYARSFVQIISYGFILNNIAYGVSNFMRTCGAPWQALGVSLVGTVVCIVLNALFVLGFGWGVVGSASATILGQVASSVWVLWYFTLNSKSPLHLRKRYLKPDGKLCLRILSLGLAPFALQAAASVTQVAGNYMMATLGAADAIGMDGALASIGVIMKVIMFAVFPVVGIATAAQPILGFNIGARKYDRVKRCLFDAVIAATAVLLCFFAIIHLWPHQLIGLFGVEEKLMDFSTVALQIMSIFMPITSLQMIGGNYFQATGQPMKAAVLSLTRQIIFLLPLYFLMPHILPAIVPSVSPLMSFCFAFPVADILSVVTCTIFLLIEIRRLNGLMREQKKGR